MTATTVLLLVLLALVAPFASATPSPAGSSRLTSHHDRPEDWFRIMSAAKEPTVRASSSGGHRLLQQANTFTDGSSPESQSPEEAIICSTLTSRLYGTHERLYQEDPCQCQRLWSNVTTGRPSRYYQLHCRYDYCPACDPATQWCAVRDETHTYHVATLSDNIEEAGGVDLATARTVDNTTSAPSNLQILYVNATYCRIFVPSESVGNTTEPDQDLPLPFCNANVYYPTTTTTHHRSSILRHDYSCQVWLGVEPTTNTTCRSCTPRVCADTETTSRSSIRTSMDCSNLPGGYRGSYCGIEVDDHDPAVGSLLDRYGSTVGVDRASSYAAALYQYHHCLLPAGSDGVTTTKEDGEYESDISLIDVYDEEPSPNLDYDDIITDGPTTDVSSTTITGRNDTTITDAHPPTAVVQSLSVSDDGSVLGIGLWNRHVEDTTNTWVEDVQVNVYHNNNRTKSDQGNNWTLQGLPVLLEQARPVGYRNDTYNIQTTPVFVRLTPEGTSLLVGHRQRDWDVFTRAYNGWPLVGHQDEIPDPFRYDIHQRLDIAAPSNNIPAFLTVARVNHPSPTSAHATHENTPLVEVWDLIPPSTTTFDNQTIGPWQWYLRPTTADDFSTVETIRMSDVSLSADGLRYAAGATNPSSFVLVQQWHPNDATNSTGRWEPIGSRLTAEDLHSANSRSNAAQTLDNGFGYRVSLSSDGTLLAVGGYKFARFFAWNETVGDWTQRGSDVEYPGGLDGELCVSTNGNAFAIGQDTAGANGTVGRLLSYQWDQERLDWSVNAVYSGLGQGDYFGRLCSVSQDGSFVAAAGSIQSEHRVGGYVEGFTVNEGDTSPSVHTTYPPTITPSAEPSQIFISRPPPTVAPTEALPTRGADAVLLSHDGSKVAIAEWTLRQRPTLISLRGVATISEQNATNGFWNVVSESDPSALFVESYNEKEYALGLDMTPDASIVMFDNYYDTLVYNITGSDFVQNAEEIEWFTGFTRTVLSDSGKTLAILHADDVDSNEAEVSVYDFLWNDELVASEWVKRGGVYRPWNGTVDITGISLSADGQTLGFASGLSSVRIMQWDRNASAWNWIGKDPSASDRDDGDTFGTDVFLSPDATNLTVSGQTFARSYTFDGFQWQQQGDDIDYPEELDGVICHAPTSDLLAVGQPTFGSDQSGRITIYQYNGKDWTSVASVDGLAAGDQFGAVCALSDDGSTVAATGTVETFQRVRGHVEIISVDALLQTPRQTDYGATNLLDNSSAITAPPSDSPTVAPQRIVPISSRASHSARCGSNWLLLLSLLLSLKVQQH